MAMNKYERLTALATVIGAVAALTTAIWAIFGTPSQETSSIPRQNAGPVLEQGTNSEPSQRQLLIGSWSASISRSDEFGNLLTGTEEFTLQDNGSYQSTNDVQMGNQSDRLTVNLSGRWHFAANYLHITIDHTNNSNLVPIGKLPRIEILEITPQKLIVNDPNIGAVTYSKQ